MATNLSTYKTELKTLLGAITFHGTTLLAANIINTYDKATVDTPVTMISLVSSKLTTNWLEAKLNKRFYQITIKVRCYTPNRMEDAQNDLDYLEEEIITKLENNLVVVAWGDGYLDNNMIASQEKIFDDNYFTKWIQFQIAKIVNITL